MRLIDADALQAEYIESHSGRRLLLIDTAPTVIEKDLINKQVAFFLINRLKREHKLHESDYSDGIRAGLDLAKAALMEVSRHEKL